MSNIMPAKSPPTNKAAQEILARLAHCIRARRQALGISMVVAAHAAGISRVTWHRIESAEPSVTVGAYVGALVGLGLDLDARPAGKRDPRAVPQVLPEVQADADIVPAAIPIRHYPQLRQLAWHVKDDFELTPDEAFGLYDRYRRHLNLDDMAPHERSLLRALENAALKDRRAV